MPYVIGYSQRRNDIKIDVCEEPTAEKALETALALQMSDETIRYIKSPHDGEIDIEMLKLLAKEERKRSGEP
jgi:hypothetical protein